MVTARNLVSCFRKIGLVALGFLGAPAVDATASEVDLTARPKANQTQQVATVIEVRGDLTFNTDGQKVRRVPMEARAELRYGERFLAADKSGPAQRTLRHYSTAAADMRIQASEIHQSLRDERQLIVSDGRETATLFSPSGPLTREELELIDTPGSSACLDLLLPGKPIATGGKWSLTDGAVTRLLGLEAVGQQDVTATLTKIEDGLAVIDLAGKVTGAVGGVSTEIDLQGKANFHLARQTISWLVLQYQEKRAVGHAQPGYDATIRVRVQTEPSADAGELSDAAVAKLKPNTDSSQTWLEFKAEKAGVEFFQDRRWRVMVDRFDTVILRLVDRGDLIAQCNITRLPSLPKGEHLSLSTFQKDVEQTLGKNLGQIVEAAQSETDQGLRILRITVAGTASELPIQWTYYHASDDAGNRASLVFTMEAKLVERFAHVDRELIESLKLSPSALDEDKAPRPASSEPKSARRSPAASQPK